MLTLVGNMTWADKIHSAVPVSAASAIFLTLSLAVVNHADRVHALSEGKML
jgi:hypothetical protein